MQTHSTQAVPAAIEYRSSVPVYANAESARKVEEVRLNFLTRRFRLPAALAPIVADLAFRTLEAAR